MSKLHDLLRRNGIYSKKAEQEIRQLIDGIIFEIDTEDPAAEMEVRSKEDIYAELEDL